MSILILVIIAIINFAAADTPQSRCKTRDCMCELRTGKLGVEPDVIEVFFAEDGSDVTAQDKRRLLNWHGGPADLIATTDGCGETNYNMALAGRRAGAVADVIQSDVRLVPIGETTEGHSELHRRTLVVRRGNRLLQQFAQYPADYYLLDGSASASRYWQTMSQFPFPRGSRVFVAKTTNCRNGMFVDEIIPEGLTELWYPLYRLLEQAEQGTTVLYASDMLSTVPLSPGEAEAITRLAERKRLTLRYVKY